jgi:hypothetical protein
MAKSSLGRPAYLLALIGGILMVVFSLLGFVGLSMVSVLSFGWQPFPAFDVLGLILGIVAIVIAKRATEPVWAIVLIVIGAIGGGFAALLVLLGGVLGLISKYA